MAMSPARELIWLPIRLIPERAVFTKRLGFVLLIDLLLLFNTFFNLFFGFPIASFGFRVGRRFRFCVGRRFRFRAGWRGRFRAGWRGRVWPGGGGWGLGGRGGWGCGV